ncbi:MAG: C39 family peptidase, partial [Clostridia bacterium]|nr:C39 family peptidase [Clostridia bacterium]
LMAAQYLTDRAIDEHMEEAALRAQEIAAAEARERAAEAARRRIEQERRKQLAEEAAKRAACPGYDAEYVASLTEEEQAEAEYFYEQGYVFFRQNWSVTKDAYYGNEGFGQCGCGPTCVAAIISNLAGIPVTPEDMRLYGLEHGSWLADAGTTYDFMITTPAQYGIKATQIYASDKEALYEALADGDKLVLATMGPGDFTLGAHFMLFRGVTEDGKILIADSYSFEYSVMEWDYDDLYAQLKNGYWVYELEESAK